MFAVMAGAAPEGSQFDARQFDQKLNDVIRRRRSSPSKRGFSIMADESDLNDYLDEEEVPISKLEKKKKKKKNKQQTTNEKEKPNEEKEETMNIRVKQISEKPDRIAPIVAYFASGYDPSDKTDGDGDGDGDGHCPDVEVYRHKAGTKSKRLQVVVSPPGSSVKFVGSNYTGEGATGQTCVYTLGVLDKEKQTLKILPIASNKIFILEPRVKNAESVDSEASLGGVGTELTAAERAVKARKLKK
ncbi:PREDICTED: uncharacterized protein LOC104822775 [Tarenaya hassleriana]|uniref:uncharacterized protein LOC104822775 n=1 Tax=Tarenaya hassleriana TaxID=28532 RepID=UPI0008FD16EE|nr:PREDICTED: uncharacterized protein LOC104822775 [Tarenaya hassleriana]